MDRSLRPGTLSRNLSALAPGLIWADRARWSTSDSTAPLTSFRTENRLVISKVTEEIIPVSLETSAIGMLSIVPVNLMSGAPTG